MGALALQFPQFFGIRWPSMRRLMEFVLVVVLCMAIVATGCGVSAAAWLTIATGLISTVLPTIPMLVQSFGSLLGHTLNAAQTQKLTAIFTGVGNLFQQINGVLTAIGTATPSASDITKIQGIVTQIQTTLNLQAILADLQVTDTATVQKITDSVNAFLDLAQNILNILPIVTAAGVVTARRVSTAAYHKVTAQGWATDFNARMQKKTGNAVVDGAFAGVVATAH